LETFTPVNRLPVRPRLINKELFNFNYVYIGQLLAQHVCRW